MEHLFFNVSQEELEREATRIAGEKTLRGDWQGREQLELEYSWPQFNWQGFDHNNRSDIDTTFCFEKYPEARGWNFEAIKQDPSLRSAHPSLQSDAIPASDVEAKFFAFLQSWLIFGFLEAVLEREINVECLTRVDKDGHSFLDTHYLTYMLYVRSSVTLALPEDEKTTLAKKLKRTEEAIKAVVDTVNHLAKPRYYPDISRGWLDEEPTALLKRLESSQIIFCSHILMEIVFYVHNTLALSQDGHNFSFSTPPKWEPLSNATMMRMMDAGFCWTFIRRDFKSLSVAEWLAWWGQKTGFPSHEDHSDCEVEECVWEKTPDDGPRHSQTCDKQQCELVTMSLDAITDTLENGRIPFVQISWDENYDHASLNVTQHSADSINTFPAVSHVWRHGLGSTSDQGLFTCQLERISQVLLTAYPEEREHTTVPFWIDSLCIPSTARHRSLALRHMNTIYENVGEVLVIDGTISNYDLSALSAESRYAAVISSAWRTRLWTFLEEYSSHKLTIVFKDRLYCVRKGDLIYGAEVPVGVPRHMELVNHQLKVLMNATVCRSYSSDYGQDALQDPSGQGLKRLIKAIGYLKATKAGDEPLVLAAILRLPTATLSAVRGEERVARFYGLLKEVPRDWIFYTVPRLTVPFYHWAPKTVMLGSVMEANNFRDVQSESGTCTSTAEGLEGDFSVVRLDQVHKDLTGLGLRLVETGSSSLCFALIGTDRRVTFVPCSDDTAHNIVVFKKHFEDSNTEELDFDHGLLAYTDSDLSTIDEHEFMVCRIVTTARVVKGSLQALQSQQAGETFYKGSFVQSAKLRFV